MAPTRSSAPDATRTTRPRRMTSENPTSCASVHLAAASAYAVDSARRQAAMVNNTNESVRHTRVCACMDPPATSAAAGATYCEDVLTDGFRYVEYHAM